MSRRITVVFSIFFILFLAILAKAFYIQVIQRKKLLAYSQSQVIRKEIIHPKRSNIYDRTGAPLAINIQAYDIFMMPQEKQMTAEEIRNLVKVLPSLNYHKIRNQVITRKSFTWIARKVRLTDRQLKQLQRISSINIEETVKRYYPNNELLSQTLGFVGVDNKGLAGIEYQLDKKLRGKKKEITYYKDAKGRPIKHESQEFEEKSEDIYLSVEKDVQIVLENSLSEVVEKYQAIIAGAGVLNADTGEIIAMANFPTYNPNNISSSQPSQRKLSFITDPFEPGSTLKILTVASALSNGVVQPNSIYYCEKGYFKIGKHQIREADTRKKHEWLSVSDIIRYSSNIGTTKIAFDLGFKKLNATFKDFHIGEKTGIELPAESKGIYDNKSRVSRIKLSNISFGQGIATTGIQMLAAYGAIANGGYYIQPTILRRNSPPPKKQILSRDIINQIETMLIQAVEKGTGKNSMIKGFTIGGKTSTAQKPSPQGGYDGHIPSFIGITYNSDTRYVVYVYVDSPKTRNYYGNIIAAPVFKKITQYLLFRNSEQVPTTERETAPPKIKAPQKRVFKKGFMPNLLGLDRKSIEEIAEKLNIKIKIEGVGISHKQSPEQGNSINSKTKIRVQLSPPYYD